MVLHPLYSASPGGPRPPEQVEGAIINYAYTRLHYSQTPGVRHQAALVLGVMSRSHLAAIAERCRSFSVRLPPPRGSAVTVSHHSCAQVPH